MDEYYQVAKSLPPLLAEELTELKPCYAPYIQEIRLRVGQAVQFTIGGKLSPAGKYLPQAVHLRVMTHALLQNCYLHLCRYSAYAYEEELRQGFFTVQGGNRIGVAGSWGPGGFSTVTSLNLRVARQITCELPPEVGKYLKGQYGGLLVAGCPGSGKTTFLRSVTKMLCETQAVVCVVDERGELLAGEGDGLKRSGYMPCDVYTRFPKAQAICMALRCMNPQYIICDELGTEADASALEQGVATGAVFLASVHCDAPENLERKPQLARLLKTGAFAAAIFLEGSVSPGKVKQWVDL